LADLVGGGTTPDLEAVLTEGNVSTLPITVGNITATDVDGGSAVLVLNYDTNNSNIIADFKDANTGFSHGINALGLTQNQGINLIDESGDVVLSALRTSNFTAVNSGNYTANGTITVTDPTGVTNKGYIVHVIGGTSTIGGVGYTTGALVYRFYNGSTWASVDMNGGGGVSDGDKGDITVSSSGTVWTIDALAVDNGKVASGIDAVKLADGSVSNTEFQYINSLSSNAQTQLNGKQATLTFDTVPTNGSTNPVESNGVFDALALKQDIPTGWTAYGGTSTIVGFSSTTIAIVNYIVMGKLLFVHFDISGTSNATTFSFTIPQTTVNAKQFGFGTGLNNTSSYGALGIYSAESSSTVNLIRDNANYTVLNTWTASGTKRGTGFLVLNII